MKSNPKFRISPIAALTLAALCLAPVAYAAQVHTAASTTQLVAKKKIAEPARPAGEVVEYADLEHRVGQDIEIETKLNTVRRGTLMKYTQPALTLKISPEASGYELTVPRETIKTITVLPPPATQDKDEGKSGAKKN